MRFNNTIQRLMLGLACCGLLLPHSAFATDFPVSTTKTTKRTIIPAVQISDVALARNFSVTGAVVDSQGIAVVGAVVLIRQGDVEVARTVTNADGIFVTKPLKGGQYQVLAGSQAQLFRFWAPGTAPPAAQKQAVIVTQHRVIRGQSPSPFGSGSTRFRLVAAAVATAALVTAIVAADDDNDGVIIAASP